MVRIHKRKTSDGFSRTLILFCILSLVFVAFLWLIRGSVDPPVRQSNSNRNGNLRIQDHGQSTKTAPQCYTSIQQLSPSERFPVAGPRHQVTPPKGGPLTLVCCETTQGPWSIAVHTKWAPLGAERFLQMVRANYFSNKVPLFRCIQNFLCQFGLAGPPSKEFDQRMPDDPQWLPAGPKSRVNDNGVKRFAHGYLSYAGAGPNTRGVQLFVALAANGGLGGGSPWEVPWGELVGDHSYTTLARISTAYGENGPSQGRLRREGASKAVAQEFPLMDYVLSCKVVDEVVDVVNP